MTNVLIEIGEMGADKNKYKAEVVGEILGRIFFDEILLEEDVVGRDLRQVRCQEVIDRLLTEKERFEHIFKTDRGSIYFQTKNGVARIKKDKDGYWDFRFVNNHIFYIPQSDAEELLEMLEIEQRISLNEHVTNEEFEKRAGVNSEYLCGKQIEVGELKKGMYPLDFEYNKNVKISYTLKDNSLIIIGNDDGHLGGSAIHIGDKIVEIIK